MASEREARGGVQRQRAHCEGQEAVAAHVRGLGDELVALEADGAEPEPALDAFRR